MVMGCRESGLKEISLTTQADWEGSERSGESLWEGLEETAALPNSLLATIPVSDLGDSLDCRGEAGGHISGLFILCTPSTPIVYS